MSASCDHKLGVVLCFVKFFLPAHHPSVSHCLSPLVLILYHWIRPFHIQFASSTNHRLFGLDSRPTSLISVPSIIPNTTVYSVRCCPSHRYVQRNSASFPLFAYDVLVHCT